MNICGTKQAAKRLGVKTSRLLKAVWEDRVKAPSKGIGGAFCWTDSDIEEAAQALGVEISPED